MATRANQLTDFMGRPYVVLPQLEDAIAGVTAGSMAITPIKFHDNNLSDYQEGGLTVGKAILVPGVVFMVFNDSTGIAIGEMEYVTTGDDIGKTRVIFRDFAEYEGFGTDWTAMCLTNQDGTPITVREADTTTFPAE